MRNRRMLWLSLVLVGAILGLAGCQSNNRRSERANRDWSRGTEVGLAAINDRVSLAMTPGGNETYLVWIAEPKAEGGASLRFARLNRAGNVVEQHDLPLDVASPTQAEVILDQGGTLHLTWVDRIGGDARGLFYAHLDRTGQLLSDARPLSLPGVTVEAYAVGPLAAGGIALFWSTQEGASAGLYYAECDSAGEIRVPNQSLGRKGLEPTFRVDQAGLIHLAWQEEPTRGERHVYYATFDASTHALNKPTEIAVLTSTSDQSGNRTCLGLTTSDVYVFWSYERRGSGNAPPAAESFYVAFPMGQPEAVSSPKQVTIPAFADPVYAQQASAFRVRELAPSTQDDSSSSSFVYLPWTTQGQRADLAVAFVVQVASRTRSTTQIVLTLWSGRQAKGYQIIGHTRTASLKPTLWVDEENDLHLSWIDTAGFGQYEVYYASTSADARANLNRTNVQDVLIAILGVLWGGVQALSLLPVTLIWTFVPVILIVIYLFLRVEDDLARGDSRLMLAVAILAYLLIKYFFRPNWLTLLALPRSWSPSLVNILTIAIPLLITGLAGLLTWLYMRRRDFASLLPTFCIFAGCDMLITVLVYAPGIFAE
jgi:hypothetical protein